MPAPSESFVNSLHAFDPLLDVRWGDHIGRWVVERKAVVNETEIWFLTRRTERFRKRASTNPTNAKFLEAYDEIREELSAAKRGKRVILMPKELGQQCFNALGLMDIRQWGGYSRMADELERQESFKEQDQERQMTNERMALHSHCFDVLDFLWRKRLTQLANGDHLRKSIKEIVGTSEL
jgi:hypothetical protein